MKAGRKRKEVSVPHGKEENSKAGRTERGPQRQPPTCRKEEKRIKSGRPGESKRQRNSSEGDDRDEKKKADSEERARRTRKDEKKKRSHHTTEGESI